MDLDIERLPLPSVTRVAWFERHPGGGGTVHREPAGWRTSTFSGGQNCVEVNGVHVSPDPGSGGCADGEDRPVLIRNSRDPDGLVLRFSRPEWDAFLAGVRSGEFG